MIIKTKEETTLNKSVYVAVIVFESICILRTDLFTCLYKFMGWD